MAKESQKSKPKGRVKKFRSQSKRLFSDRLFKWYIVGSFVMSIAVITLLLIRVRPVEFAVPLQYSTLQGFDGLGAWYRIYLYGFFALIITIGNLWLAILGYDKSRITSFFLIMGSSVINLFLLVIIWTLTSHLEV